MMASHITYGIRLTGKTNAVQEMFVLLWAEASSPRWGDRKSKVKSTPTLQP